MGRPADIGSTPSQEALEAELSRLQNAVKHLVRSNEELADARAEGDNDPELQEALQVALAADPQHSVKLELDLLEVQGADAVNTAETPTACGRRTRE